MKKILVLSGHPVQDTFTDSLTEAYVRAAKTSDSEVRLIMLRDLPFELNFKEGYRGNQSLEPCLVEAQESIRWADHLVFIYPNWWSTFPALLKGFIDRTFLPGFAFKYKSGSLSPEKLLVGKTARIIVTMDSPIWYYKIYLLAPGHNAMKKGILQFCGFKPVRITSIGPVRGSSETKRSFWLRKVEKLGSGLK